MEQRPVEAGGEPASGTRAFGFLTTVESAAHGVFGGYLLVDPWGRPLEFHCTAPVKVSRAQQILYGATLAPHLHGQQIGATLLAEGDVVPRVVLTDLESMMHVRGHTHLPVALVGGPPAGATEPPAGGIFIAGNATVSTHESDADRRDEMRGAIEELAASVDLREPFERIRAAIEEAQRH
jgi:hypothetical protein